MDILNRNCFRPFFFGDNIKCLFVEDLHMDQKVLKKLEKILEETNFLVEK